MAADEEKGSKGLMGSSSCSKRQRFYIELEPGETTIVSWKKLVRDDEEKEKKDGHHSSASAHETALKPKGLDGKFQVGQCTDSFSRSERPKLKDDQKSRKRKVVGTKGEGEKRDGPSSAKHVKLEKLCTKSPAKSVTQFDKSFSQFNTAAMVKDHHIERPHDAPMLVYSKKSTSLNGRSNCSSHQNEIMGSSVFPLKIDRSFSQKTGNIAHEKSRIKKEVQDGSSDVMRHNSAGRSIPLQTNIKSRNSMLGDKKTKVSSKSRHNNRSGQSMDLVDAISSGRKSSLKNSKDVCAAVNDTTSVRPICYVLERAIKELEKTVAESKPFGVEALDVHTTWLTIEKRLPFEVTWKLGKVAGILQSYQETVSKELVNRLVSILGKLVHGKTGKRLLRKVVLLKLSLWKDKAEKFSAIKDDILEMVYNRQIKAARSSKGKEAETSAERYKLDGALEDKLCGQYESCVQGLDEDEGVQLRELFTELADLWPRGVVDHHKLKEAISNTKSRRKSAGKNQVQIAVHNDNFLGKILEGNVNRNIDPVPGLKKKVTDTGYHCNLVSPFHGKTAPNKAAGTHPHLQEQQTEVGEKRKLKIKFLLKQEDGSQNSGEQAAKDTLNHLRAAASLTCKQLS